MKSAGAEDGALFTNSYCNICNAQLISESQRVAHYESKKHANKVRLYYMLHPEDGGPPSKKLRPDDPESDETEVDKNKCCTLCNMFFTSAIVAESHYQGKIHAKRVKLVLGESLSTPTAPEPTQEPPEPQDMNTDDCVTAWISMNGGDSGKSCNLCRAWFNNPLMAQQHYEGKKHKKNAARARLLQRLGETLDAEALEALRSSYSCNLCHVVLNSIEQFHAHLQGARHQSNVNGGNPDEPKNGSHVLQLSSEALVSDGGSCGTSPAKYSKRKRWATFSSDDTSGSSSPTAPETQLVLEGAAYFQDGLQATLFSGVLMKRSRIIY